MIAQPMRILFLTSAHSSIDDRILYHQALSLANGHQVCIYSTFSGKTENIEGVEVVYDNTQFLNRKSKIRAFTAFCESIVPDVVICSEPLPILGAYRYKRNNSASSLRILYDVTEFYPSKKNLQGISGFKKVLKTIAFVWLNKKAAAKADGFIFGEYFKALFYKSHFKRKPYLELPYYQDLSYYPIGKSLPNIFTIGYSGKFSEEKGIMRFAEVLHLFSQRYDIKNWQVKMIGWFESEAIEKEFMKRTQGLPVEIVDNLPFKKFCQTLSEFSVFLDLRDTDPENNLCVPIKLFSYASAGRPIIYSALQAIESTYPQKSFITSKRIDDLRGVVEQLSLYIENQGELEKACKAASEFAEGHQWDTIKADFIRFVTNE